MDLLFALLLSLALLLFSVVKGYFIAYPLTLSLAIFTAVLSLKGFSTKKLLSLAIAGSRKSFSVLNILLLIGATTAIWMASGTVPALVYYGVQLINPHYFILAAFILTSCVSTLLGTSFGAVSTMGVALMIMAKGSGVSPHMIAGAVIAGAYFGDRCSPMSSSANLIAALTKTKLHVNINNMLKTGNLPFIVSSLSYLILSIFNPVQLTKASLTVEIAKVFNVHLYVLIPALVVIALALFRVDVKLSLLSSALAAIAIAVFFQGYSLPQVLQFALFGFNLESAPVLKSIIAGGGIMSMARVSVVVIVSTALAGLLAGTKVLDSVELLLKRVSSRSELFLATAIIGIATAAFGCTQTIAIVLTQQLVNAKYKEQLDNYQLATDLENTVVVLSPLIPWNIAGLVPATILTTDLGFIPYAVYLYLLPIFGLIQFRLSKE